MIWDPVLQQLEELTEQARVVAKMKECLFHIWFNLPFLEIAFRDLCQCRACLKKLPEDTAVQWKQQKLVPDLR